MIIRNNPRKRVLVKDFEDRLFLNIYTELRIYLISKWFSILHLKKTKTPTRIVRMAPIFFTVNPSLKQMHDKTGTNK